MKNNVLLVCLSISLWIISCQKQVDQIQTIQNDQLIDTAGIIHATPQGLMDDGYDADDLLENENFDKIVTIQFGYPIQIQNNYSDEVTIQYVGNDVMVTATGSNIQYVLTGSAPDGSIKFYSDKKFQLTLQNLELHSNQGAPINIQSKKRVFVHLPHQSVNTLSDASHYTNIGENEDLKAAFFSEGQMIFNGTGSLTIEANYKHAICSDDYLRFREGTYNITKAASDAIHANEYIIMDGGNFTIRAESDGIEAEKGYIIINDGQFDIDVVDDGIVASYNEDETITPYIIIHNGNIQIKTTEGEGIESKKDLYIHNGNIHINAFDDAVNAHRLVLINNGIHYFHSEFNDGIDSNYEIQINGGFTMAFGTRTPEGGIDNDNFPFYINGGVLLAAGGKNSWPLMKDVQQPVLLFTIARMSQKFAIMQSNKVIGVFTTPERSHSLLYSDSRLKLNEEMLFIKDVEIRESSQILGMHFDGIVTGGTIMARKNIHQKVLLLDQF